MMTASDQQTLNFDAAAAAAEARKEAGMTAAAEHSGEDWQTYAREFLRRYCATHCEVFCDDVWAAGLERPESPRAFGAVMHHAIREGWIVATDQARPSHQSNNQRRTVYRSRLHRTGP